MIKLLIQIFQYHYRGILLICCTIAVLALIHCIMSVLDSILSKPHKNSGRVAETRTSVYTAGNLRKHVTGPSGSASQTLSQDMVMLLKGMDKKIDLLFERLDRLEASLSQRPSAPLPPPVNFDGGRSLVSTRYVNPNIPRI